MPESASVDGSATQIFLVDEQPTDRERLRNHFEEGDRFTVVGEAKSGEDALAPISDFRQDLAVLNPGWLLRSPPLWKSGG